MNLANRLRPLGQKLAHVDLRSLAMMRIGIALILLYDLSYRLTDLSAHYTDLGIFPRSLALEFMMPWEFSLHMLSGQAVFQLGLFFIHYLLVIGLLFGYRTRLFTLLNCLMLLSLHMRNTQILYGADAVLGCILFWANFIPWGAKYSIDAALNTDHPAKNSFASWGSFALLVQVSCIYIFTGILKNDPIWTEEGSALYYALMGPELGNPLGFWIAQFESLTQFLTFSTLYLEIFGPFLLFVPFARLGGPLRTLAVFSFIGLHVGIFLTMNIGIFAPVCTAMWVGLLPSWFWDQLHKRMSYTWGEGIKIYYDGQCGFCLKMALTLRMALLLPKTELIPAAHHPQMSKVMDQEQSWIIQTQRTQAALPDGYALRFAAFMELCRSSLLARPFAPILSWAPIAAIGDTCYRGIANRRMQAGRFTRVFRRRQLNITPTRLGQTLAAVMIAYVVAWNLRTLDKPVISQQLPQSFNWVAQLTGIGQKWNMFAPFPALSGGWYRMPGETVAGRELDIWSESRIQFGQPAVIGDTYRGDRWKKYMMSLWTDGSDSQKRALADYLCDNWNGRHDSLDRVKSFDMSFFYYSYQRGTREPTEVQEDHFWEWECYLGGSSNKDVMAQVPKPHRPVHAPEQDSH